MKSDETTSVRMSVSFPASTYEILERLARKKKVSLAWVVRDAVDQYLVESGKALRANEN